MIYCSNCGTPNQDEATFCNSCGTQLSRPPSSEQRVPQQTTPQGQPIATGVQIEGPPLIDGLVGNLPGPLSPARTPDWYKVLIGSLVISLPTILTFPILFLFMPCVIFVPLLYILPIGYGLGLSEQVIYTGKYFPLPNWTNWGEITKRGGVGLVIRIIYAIPALLIVVAGFILGNLINEPDLGSVIAIFAGLPLLLISWIISDMAICNYIRAHSFSAAFQWIEIFGLAWRAAIPLVIGYLIFAFSFFTLQFLGLLVFGIGVFVTMFIQVLLYSVGIARIYRFAYGKMNPQFGG